MRHTLFVAVFALFILACGEVGDETNGSSSSGTSPGGSSSSGNSQGGGGNSSSQVTAVVCSGLFCCNGAEFDNSTNFCHEDQLYPRCGNSDYNPYEKGCFDGTLYPRCSLENTRGLCVHESLLRCRQEGRGDDKIIDPLPRMACQPNGAITGTIDDYRNGVKIKTYNTVQISNQVWLAENLDYYPGPNKVEGAVVLNSKCYGDEQGESNPGSCGKQGRLYDWATAMGLSQVCNGTSQGCPPSHQGLWIGLCPNGFAFPRSEDWKQLVDYAGGSAIAGGRLKSKEGWSSNGNGTDNYGFNALPGGYSYYWGIEDRDSGSSSYWWVETQANSEAYYWNIISSDTEVRNRFFPKDMDMAYVRCLHY
jgi:uncharacterized protein (TIGR02145 family)